MILPFTDALITTSPFDPEMAALADRHYSRRTVGSNQFMNNGRKLVIRNTEGTILFGWMFPDPTLRFDAQTGLYCAIFRNESDRRSSDVILECEQIAIERWGQSRMYTFIDPRKVRSANPGYCFKCAGWRFEGMTKSGKHVLVKHATK